MEIVLATRNKGKIIEIKELLRGLRVKTLTLEDFPYMELPPEDLKSFKENALRKAHFVADRTKLPALADDSGLEVDALDGMPGVVSARFAGKNATDGENNEKLLKELKDIPFKKRTARFVCVMAFAAPDGRAFTFEGILKGFIGKKPKGSRGFGYDPLFVLPKSKKTLAELPAREKNNISHRGNALRKFREWLLGCSDGFWR